MLSPIFTIFIVILCLFFTIFLRSFYELSHFNNTKITIGSNKITKKYSFLFITDLHEKEYGKNNKLLVDFLNNYNTDILIGGDLITFTKRCNKNNDFYTKNTIKLINQISKKHNIYYAFGNHELRLQYKKDDNDKLKIGYNEFYNQLINNNIKVLDNKYIDLDNNIRIYGYSLNNKYYKKKKRLNKDYQSQLLEDIDKNIPTLDKTKYNICLLHNPDFAELIIDYGVDMVLSGHHHGGMIRLPLIGSILSPDLKLLPKYSRGLYFYKNKPIIVSAGLGEHSIRFRLNNICELCSITINKENGTNTI